MGHRLSKIYTRTGDTGTTALGDGARVDKDCLRIESYGSLDELNALIGVVLACDLREDVRDLLEAVQHHLFDLGAELCIPGYERIQQNHIDSMEASLDKLNEELPPLKEFILPGGNQASAACHVARTVCRRCERLAVGLARESSVNPCSLQYLNRLSDLLFVVARILARQQGGDEVLWKNSRNPS